MKFVFAITASLAAIPFASTAQTLAEVENQVKAQISDFGGKSDTLKKRSDKALAIARNTGDCYWGDLEHVTPSECSASIDLKKLADDDFELTVSTGSKVNPGQCVRIGGFVKTQYDIDNNIPVTEEVWFQKTSSEVIPLQKSDFNGREPVSVDAEKSCKLSIDPKAAFCEVSPGIISEIGTVLQTTEPGLAEYKQALSYVRNNPGAVPWDANSILAIWGEGHDAFVQINSDLNKARDELNRQSSKSCN